MKKLITLSLLLLIFITTISISISYFKSQDTNTENYIHIGKLNLDFYDISMFAYIAEGPALTFGAQITPPNINAYNLTRKLSDYPYFAWSQQRRIEILNAIKRNNGLILSSNPYFAKQPNNSYLDSHPIYFNGNHGTAYSNNRGLHLFVAIYNNAHLIKKPRKINIKREQNLNIEANVTFKGTLSRTTWETNYKSNIDIYNKKYYVTNTYYYNRTLKKFISNIRDTIFFFKFPDLIIIDLGTTGYIEDDGGNWLSETRRIPKHKLLLKMNDTNDTQAKIIKANYNITFTPSWNSNKVLMESINLN